MSNSEYLRTGIEADEDGSKNSPCQPNSDFHTKMTGECLVPGKEISQLQLVEVAKRYMRNNFCNQISVEQIAKAVFVSQYHFSRIFKKHTRYSPHQYLMHLRLQQAKKLLQQKELTIQEICFQSGFNRVDYFSAAFARKYSKCPSLYKKELF